MASHTTIKLPEKLVKQLLDFRRRLRIIKMLEAVCLTGIAIVLCYILMYASDRLWETPDVIGWILFFAAIVGLLFIIPWWWIRWVWNRRTSAQLAKMIADKDAPLGDRLLGIIELDEELYGNQPGSDALKEAAMKQVAEEVSKLDLSVNIPKPRHKRLLVLFSALITLTAIAACINPDAANNALKRWLTPYQPPERYTFTQLNPVPDKLIIPLGESFIFEFSLADTTQNHPESATYSFNNEVEKETALTEKGTYAVHIPPLQITDMLVFRVGDAVKRVQIIPKTRPSLLSASASIKYPAYMARPDGKDTMKAGVIAAPEGSTLNLSVIAGQPLRSATKPQNISTLNVKGDTVNIPGITVGTEGRDIEFTWIDNDGIASAHPIRVRLEPIEDKTPAVYLRGDEQDRYVLEDTGIELEIEAADDFGLKELGVEWVGEGSFTADAQALEAANEANAEQAPAKTEKILAYGEPTQTNLKEQFLFQAKELKLPPQRVTIRAFTQDYKPGSKRVYSEPMSILVLSKADHAQMIRTELDRISGELEGMVRRMDAMTDEVKRLQELSPEDFNAAETGDRLNALADEEQANRRELEDMIRRAEDLFKEAARNSQIDPAGMKEFMKGIAKLKPISPGNMLQAQKNFRKAAEKHSQQSSQNGQQNSSEQSNEDMKEAAEAHEQAAEDMKDAMSQLNKASQDMEASTFVSRLRQAAIKEDTIAGALANKIRAIVGLTMEELDPSFRRELNAIAELQNASTEDIQWILEDLNYYKSRTESQIYGDLYNQMEAFSLREKLDAVHGNILKSITAKSIDESRAYATVLRHWAQLIDDYQNEQGGSQGGGGGAGGGGGEEDKSLSDSDFEFMLKVLRMIQQEQDLRMRTRAAEQEHRKSLKNNKPVNR